MFEKSLLLLVLLWPFVCTYASVSAGEKETADIVGRAYDFDTGELVYTEHHHFVSAIEHKVVYREPDGVVFTTKTIRYDDSDYAPDIVQQNQRIGEKIMLDNKQGKIIDGHYSRESDGKRLDAEITAGESLVIDAGFDRFIADHWKSLTEGEDIDFDYLIPTRLRSVGLVLGKVDCKNNNQQVCFRIKPKSWLFTLFSTPIVVTYEKSPRRLIHFSGRSNIASKSGEYHLVNIEYFYP